MLVDEDHPAVYELGGNVLAASEIAREDPAAKPKDGVVGRCNRLLLVLDRYNRSDRPKYLLVKRGHSLRYVGQHCRRIVGTAPVRDRPAQQIPCALGDAGLDLLMHHVAQIVT